MENNENRQNEELQFSNQDHTLDSDNTTVRKTRIKHKRRPRKKKEKKTMSKNTKKRIFITLGSVVGVVAEPFIFTVIFIRTRRSMGAISHGRALRVQRSI